MTVFNLVLLGPGVPGVQRGERQLRGEVDVGTQVLRHQYYIQCDAIRCE